MVRMKLADVAQIASLEFDLPRHTLTLYHTQSYAPILERLESLHLHTTLAQSVEATEPAPPSQPNRAEKKLLRQVLLINFFFFVFELTSGIVSQSMSLVADSLDMLADSIVYGLALWAVGGSAARKMSTAKSAGYFQMALAVIGFAEVIRRFIGIEEVPGFRTMIVVSVLALMGNGLSWYLLQKNTSKEVHMQASMIFTTNDVLANLGVITGGVLVYLTHSKYPDLIMGTLVFFIVGNGARRIIQLSKS